MAKNMARIKNDIVVNIEWCSDETHETDVLKDMKDCPAAIGDTYTDGAFYRNGERVLTESERICQMVAEYECALFVIENILGV